ncbi:protein kinase [Nocardia sp. NPDC057668]|uniref:protein kinase domain-containing protein n=1 Tax=Nocardia sp. NPDC057668 TaxID=3346202 RepID=UPI0036711B2B
MSLPPGSVFAGFTIERLLGAGGMGAVYLAEHPRLRRRVALKVLAATFTSDAKARSAFTREADLAAGLDHPNIVPVYDRSELDDPALWLAMRHIEGGDVAALLEHHPAGLAPARAVRLITDAACALDHAHARGVLHRDVKPANLLIEHDRGHGERAVLTDFGIARTLDDTVTLSGIAATFAYAAPERFSDTPADHRADIYSLGCTLFQLLTGRQPYARKDQAAVIGAHLTAPPPSPREVRPDLRADLDAVLATALAKSPDARYPTCTALAEAAARALPPIAPTERAAPARPVVVSNTAARTDSAPRRDGASRDEAAIPTVVGAAAPRPVPIPAPVDLGKPAPFRGDPPQADGPDLRATAPPSAGKPSLPAASTTEIAESSPQPHTEKPALPGSPAAVMVADFPPPARPGRRAAAVSGVLLTAITATVAITLAIRGNSESPTTTTPSTTSVAVSTITTPVTTAPPPPATTAPPAEVPPPVETEPYVAPAPPAQQVVPTYSAPRPQVPATQAPAIVPQTRVHQWPG